MAATDFDPPQRGESRRSYGLQSHGLGLLAVWLVFFALAVVCYWHMWSSNISRVSFPDGDQYVNMWNLDWTAFALTHGHNVFFSSYINYPHGANLLTNTGEPLLGLVAVPITLLWGPVASFNIMMTVALAVSAFAGYVFVSHWVKWWPAAFLGGLLYGFSPYEIAQGNVHLNLTFVPLPPLILLCSYKLITESDGSAIKRGFLLGILIIGQFFISTEVLADTAVIATGGLILVSIGGHRVWRRYLRRSVIGLSTAGGIAAVALAYPVWFALAGPGSISGPVQLEPQNYRADLLGPVIPGIFQAIGTAGLRATSSSFAGNAFENTSYLGPTLLLLLAVGAVVLWRQFEVRICALLGAAAFVLSLGDRLAVGSSTASPRAGHILPGWLLFHLPLYSNAVPARFSLYVSLFAGLLLGISIERIAQWFNSGRHRAAAVSSFVPLAIGLVALIPDIPAVPYVGLTDVSAPEFYQHDLKSVVETNSAIVTYPYVDNNNASVMAWQAQTFMHFKMPGGDILVPQPSTGREVRSSLLGSALTNIVGTTFTELENGREPPRTSIAKSQIRNQFRSWKVRDVVATPSAALAPTQAESYLEWLFGTPRQVVAGTMYWRL